MKEIIRFCYRLVITASSTEQWQKDLWNDSYAELRMQSQLYNTSKQYRLYSELVKAVPAAVNLDHLVSITALSYLKSLDGQMPVAVNTMGESCLKFQQFRFEILESDFSSVSAHVIAINFYSDKMYWIDTIADHLLVAATDQDTSVMLTNLIKLVPNLNIYSFENGTDKRDHRSEAQDFFAAGKEA